MQDSNSTELEKLEGALFGCIRITKRQSYWEEFQKRADVTIDRPAAFILMVLGKRSLQFQDLVNKLGVEAPSVSRKVHELENDGFIKRQSTADRRIHLLTLTKKGADVTSRINKARRAIFSEIMSGWPDEDKKQLSRLLAKLSEDLSNRFSPKKMQK
jgi:DNA-binding MarR family transcriptional regulator